MKRLFAVAIVIVSGLASAAALAQHKGSGSGSGSGNGSGSGQPYASLDKRGVASFPDDEVAGIRDGRGMGYALPAELNGYPGPMHILELAAELEITAAQRSEIEVLFQRMKDRARAAGEAYVAAEMALDQVFKSQKADAQTIAQLTRNADAKRADKRLAHLDAHIEARRLLSEPQLQRYATLRGYGTK